MLLKLSGTEHVCSALFSTRLTRTFSSDVVERWKDITGFSKYQISSFGNIKHKRKNRIRYINHDRFRRGHHPTQCCMQADDGRIINATVSRLVLGAFDATENHNELCAFHLDGNNQNNKIENLEWRKRDHIFSGQGRPTSPVRMKCSSKPIDCNSVADAVIYLKSLGIDAAHSTVCYWCLQREFHH